MKGDLWGRKMSAIIPVKCTGCTARCCSNFPSLLQAEKFGAARRGKGAGLQEGLEGVDGVLPNGLKVLREYSLELWSPSEATNKGAGTLCDIMGS